MPFNYLLPAAVFFGNLSSNGALAQLGERLHGMQEVEGSSPFGSIHPGIGIDVASGHPA